MYDVKQGAGGGHGNTTGGMEEWRYVMRVGTETWKSMVCRHAGIQV